MAYYLLYNASGKITGHGSCPNGEESNQVNEGEFLLIERYRENIYIDTSTSTIVDKTSMPSVINKETLVANGVDEIIISNLENPTDIILERLYGSSYFLINQYEIDDGTFEVSF